MKSYNHLVLGLLLLAGVAQADAQELHAALSVPGLLVGRPGVV